MAHNDFTVAAVCADLLFSARIRGAAGAAGVKSLTLTAGDDVPAKVLAEAPDLVLLDLDARWLDAPAVIRALKAEPRTAAIPVVAFVSHVREDAIAGAREAGADRVLARSAFVRQLPELLRGV